MTRKPFQEILLYSSKIIRLVWRTAASDWLLVKRAMFGSLIDEIVRLAKKLNGGWS